MDTIEIDTRAIQSLAQAVLEDMKAEKEEKGNERTDNG